MRPAFALAALSAACTALAPAAHAAPAQPCAALMTLVLPDTVLTVAEQKSEAPPHCMVRGTVHPRTGANGVAFGDQFELRLPVDWNARFYFQGGGGTDGFLPAAIGTSQPAGNAPALSAGYAVVATDGGHEDKDSSFGLDAEAREDWGYQVIARVATVSKALIQAFYGVLPRYSYLIGCSNGGRQAMVAAQRYPALFDGLVAGDPVFHMSASHIDTAWDLQAFTAIAPPDNTGAPILSRAFSDADLALVAADILRRCDAADGLADGLVSFPSACAYSPAALQCTGAKTASCLTGPQVAALSAVFGGAKDSDGHALYSTWPWDPGIASAGWRAWKLGTSTTPVPNAIKAGLSNNAIKHVFLTPPDANFSTLHFDFDRDPARLRASSAFADATSPDLAAFAARGGRILFYHGMADPAISANDTIAYYRTLLAAGPDPNAVAAYARLFLVPGMNHCSGGSGLDSFDVLTAIRQWVEEQHPPARLIASGSNFPGRTRPLCPYPQEARYDGRGPAEQAESFICDAPRAIDEAMSGRH